MEGDGTSGATAVAGTDDEASQPAEEATMARRRLARVQRPAEVVGYSAAAF